MEKVCPCKKEFYCPPAKVERKKYCSKVCFYAYRKTGGWNKGLKGTQPANSGSFKKGERRSPETEFKKGHGWKGDAVGYDALHEWVEKQLGKPSLCQICGTTESKVFQWSNKTEKYLRDLSDWQRLCVKCHINYDYKNFGKRKAFFEK